MKPFAGRLAIDLPIIQAPMAGSQGSALAIAVSNAGGLGSLPCATLGLEAIRRGLAELSAATAKPFNVNFFCHVPPPPDPDGETRWRARLHPYYREFGIDPDTVDRGPVRRPFDAAAAALVEEFRPAVVSFHFGLPSAPLLARVRASGAIVMSSATTVDEAVWLEAHGADVIIAQGSEAGGHRGMFLSDDLSTQVGTFALVPQIVKRVSVPVIAAGGVADAGGVAAALRLGAAAVQVGTSYLLCREATTTAVHRTALASPVSGHTALTNIFTGRPARSILNRVMRELGPLANEVPRFPLAASAILPIRAKAEAAHSGDFSPLWCGQNATGCRAVPAAQLTRELAGV